MRKRLSFDHFVDKVFWAIMIAIAAYTSTNIKSMSENIGELNQKMAVVLEKIGYQEKHSDVQDRRLDKLEEHNQIH